MGEQESARACVRGQRRSIRLDSIAGDQKMSVRAASSTPAVTRLPSAFHRLAWSNLAAQSAEQIGLAATPIVAVFALHAGAGQTGWLQTAQTLPFLVFSMLLGVWADQTSRRTLMARAEAVRCAALLVVLAALVSG